MGYASRVGAGGSKHPSQLVGGSEVSPDQRPVVERHDLPGGRLVRISGVADERLELLPALDGATGVVIIDLDQVHEMTSSGVRRWMLALKTAQASYLGFIRCRPNVVVQFNSIEGFGSPGELISFYLGYLCGSCGEYFERLFDVRKSRSIIESLSPPEESCPKCGRPAECDDVPESYFYYVTSAPPPNPPPLALGILARGTDHIPFHIEKSPERSMTLLWASGQLDRTSSFKRLAIGLEGRIVLMCGAIDGITAEGAERLDEFLKSTSLPLYLCDVPMGVALRLCKRSEAAATERWLSIQYSVGCPYCRVVGNIRLDRADVDQLVMIGQTTARCDHCNRIFRIEVDERTRHALRGHRMAAAPDKDLLEVTRTRATPPSRRQEQQAAAGEAIGTIGRYELLEKIATGGMAEVFVARQNSVGGFEKRVVIKRILPQLAADPDFIEMFLQEARLAALINSPFVVQTYDVGRASGHFFIALEYVQGIDLAALLRATWRNAVRPSLVASAQVVADACRGLDAAHRLVDAHGLPSPVIHRDVSPHNILVAQDGRAKLSDFGIAKAINEASRTPVTLFKGKISYAAPEVLADRSSPVDGRADIFAAGLVLYECVTGKHPFRRGSEAETVRAVQQAPLPAPSTHNSLVSAELDQIILRALERDVSRRYQSAGEFADALDGYLASTPDRRRQLAEWVTRTVSDLDLTESGPVHTLDLATELDRNKRTPPGSE